ncbi:MAG TPA: carboxypeptidase-like regulatory domain-containing protein, partial [Thermoanaerobaculaceae bacterium]|nr:carboxypeptidase-like regulatory domain-containing protein [Thermoanaerobaculaceae bacterium]
MKRFAVLALLLGLVALPLFAQNPTGTLSGRSTDGKEALPGVTVTVTSPNLQGARTAVTSVDGDYIFKFLPPGEYRVKFELSGFQTQETTVKISGGVSSKVDATMPMAQVAEEVTVTGSYETISTASQLSTTYEKALVDKLPIGRDLTAYMAMTPGVSAGTNGYQISGAQSADNLYMVNGVVVHENLRGQSTPLYVEDAIQETTTSTASISAEYGRFSGGVVNTLTKSGGNEFSGSYRMSLDNGTWIEKTKYAAEAAHSTTTNKIHEATLGGFF